MMKTTERLLARLDESGRANLLKVLDMVERHEEQRQIEVVLDCLEAGHPIDVLFRGSRRVEWWLRPFGVCEPCFGRLDPKAYAAHCAWRAEGAALENWRRNRE